MQSNLLHLCIVYWLTPHCIHVSEIQEKSLAHSKPSLDSTAFILTYLPAIPCHFYPCCTGGKTEVRSHLVIYWRWHSEQIGEKKTRSPFHQPNSLSKSQSNLAALLLCYKMNNCLWVHSQAHDCLYITSKNLRQAKDRALWILLRNSAFPFKGDLCSRLILGTGAHL